MEDFHSKMADHARTLMGDVDDKDVQKKDLINDAINHHDSQASNHRKQRVDLNTDFGKR